VIIRPGEETHLRSWDFLVSKRSLGFGRRPLLISGKRHDLCSSARTKMKVFPLQNSLQLQPQTVNLFHIITALFAMNSREMAALWISFSFHPRKGAIADNIVDRFPCLGDQRLRFPLVEPRSSRLPRGAYDKSRGFFSAEHGPGSTAAITSVLPSRAAGPSVDDDNSRSRVLRWVLALARRGKRPRPFLFA